MGGYNGRVGNLQNINKASLINYNLFVINKNRKSKDHVVNSNGKKILELLNDFNLIILNGRFKNDELGEFTCVGGQGKIKKKEFYDSIITQIQTVTDAKQYWDVVKVFKKQAHCVSGDITMDEWVNHFQTLYNPPLLADRVLYAEPFNENIILDEPFEMHELVSVLKEVKHNKAPGTDRITYEFYENMPENYLLHLLDTYNKIFESGKVPISFKESIIYPLYKKGQVNCASNYRGIAFVLKRLSRWVEENKVIK
ncbi:hypothetical protein O3M35_013068 [Rhynocoris fuscipes]|uniref:Uncharacterized protein n=1 Tax=Rhynocoris fuscipes TaxID=488301 RepID=A0AAW1CF36_9HEMI